MSKLSKLMVSLFLVACGAAVLIAQPVGNDANTRGPRGPRAEPEPVAGAAVTDQEEAELLQYLSEKRPEEARELKKLKEDNPRAYRWALGSAWRLYQTWKDAPPEIQKAHDVQIRARVEAWRISREVLAAKDPNQKEKLNARLSAVLGEEFDADQLIREHRLNQLEEQLKRLRAELKDRGERRSQVIERSREDLLAGKGPIKAEAEMRRPVDGRPHTAPATTLPAQ